MKELDCCPECECVTCRCDEPWSLAWAGVVQGDEDGD